MRPGAGHRQVHGSRRALHRWYAARHRVPRVQAPRPGGRPVTDEAERRRRQARLATYFVNTLNRCPAPGVAPLTTRDWLLIMLAVLAPPLVVDALAWLAHRS